MQREKNKSWKRKNMLKITRAMVFSSNIKNQKQLYLIKSKKIFNFFFLL